MKYLILGLAALAAAAPVPSGTVETLPVEKQPVEKLPVEKLEITELEDVLTKVETLTKDVKLLRRSPQFELPVELPVVSDLEAEVTGLVDDLPTGDLPAVTDLVDEVTGLVEDLPTGDLSAVTDLVDEVTGLVEDLPAADIPTVTEIEDEVLALIPDQDAIPIDDLPTVQDVLDEVDGILPGTDGILPTDPIPKRGLINDVTEVGVDLLNSQDVVPLENTLSEFDETKSESEKESPEPVCPSKKSWAKGTKYLSTFDDLTPAIPGVALFEVGPYNGLDYNGIDLASSGVDGTVVTGLIPESPPNVGVYGLTSSLVSGLPNITTVYEGTVTETFDLHSFYFGCAKGLVETVATEALSCNVTVTGYRNEKAVAEQTFIFTYNTVTDNLNTEMTEAVLGCDFQDIDTATFDSTYDLSAEVGATQLDSLKYTVYGKKKGGEDEIPTTWH